MHVRQADTSWTLLTLALHTCTTEGLIGYCVAFDHSLLTQAHTYTRIFGVGLGIDRRRGNGAIAQRTRLQAWRRHDVKQSRSDRGETELNMVLLWSCCKQGVLQGPETVALHPSDG